MISEFVLLAIATIYLTALCWIQRDTLFSLSEDLETITAQFGASVAWSVLVVLAHLLVEKAIQ